MATQARAVEPTWKLGAAAYSFEKLDGWATNCVRATSMVSWKPGSIRGGATGNTANTTSPTRPDRNRALRRSTEAPGRLPVQEDQRPGDHRPERPHGGHVGRRRGDVVRSEPAPDVGLGRQRQGPLEAQDGVGVGQRHATTGARERPDGQVGDEGREGPGRSRRRRRGGGRLDGLHLGPSRIVRRSMTLMVRERRGRAHPVASTTTVVPPPPAWVGPPQPARSGSSARRPRGDGGAPRRSHRRPHGDRRIRRLGPIVAGRCTVSQPTRAGALRSGKACGGRRSGSARPRRERGPVAVRERSPSRREREVGRRAGRRPDPGERRRPRRRAARHVRRPLAGEVPGRGAAGRDPGRRPRVWIFEGQELPNFGLNAVAGPPPEEYGVEPDAFEQMRPGATTSTRASTT